MLGSFPVHFAMLLTILGTVDVPLDEAGQYKEGWFSIYTQVWIMHLTVSLVLVLNHLNGASLGGSKDTLNTLATIFYVIVIIQLGVNYVFENQEEDLSLSESNYEVPTGYQTQTSVRLTKDEIKLKFWLFIELIIFFANVASNIVFMLYRSCSNARIYSSTTGNIEEGIEKHQLLVSMCSAFFTPFIGALCLIIFEMRW